MTRSRTTLTVSACFMAAALACAALLATFRSSARQQIGARRLALAARSDPRPEPSTPSVCGEAGPIGTVVTLDGTRTATADATGRYRFDNASRLTPPGLPKGQHLLTAHGDGLRTKVIRLTEDWLARSEKSCQPLNIHLSQRGAQPIDTTEAHGATMTDNDGDGVDDLIENWLAERFAPVVHHGEKETSFPASVDFWLARTHLSVIEEHAGRARLRRVVTGPLTQHQLLGHGPPESGLNVSSERTRSRGKRSSFFLEDVGARFRAGERENLPDWVTYVHSYANQRGGVTIQYWRAYTWNQARLLLFDLSHGGDWEGIAVHLDSSLTPEKVSYLQHAGIIHETDAVQWAGTHPLVWSEEGGHSSYPGQRELRSSRWIRQETWTGGQTTWWDGAPRGRSGGLLNLGEKSRPLNGQVFIKYSGLWGSKKRLFITSGYWGPSFNETGAQCSNGRAAYEPALRHNAESNACGRVFLKAWCDGMTGAFLNLSNECYALRDIP